VEGTHSFRRPSRPASMPCPVFQLNRVDIYNMPIDAWLKVTNALDRSIEDGRRIQIETLEEMNLNVQVTYYHWQGIKLSFDSQDDFNLAYVAIDKNRYTLSPKN
jgi:hypothetical protein